MSTNSRKRVLQTLDVMDAPGSTPPLKRVAAARFFSSAPASPNNQNYDGGDECSFNIASTPMQKKKKDVVASVSRFQLKDFLKSLEEYTESDFLDVAPEKNPNFFRTYDTQHLGTQYSIRSYRGFVFLRKYNGERTKDSIIKFPSVDLEWFLRSVLVPMYNRILKTSTSQLFRNSATQNYKLPEFWNDGLVMESPRGDVKMRPFLNGMSTDSKTVYIRMWQPTEELMVTNKENDRTPWFGPAINMSLNNFLGIITMLGTTLEQYWASEVDEDDADGQVTSTQN